jgi:protein translocase SecG subunit
MYPETNASRFAFSVCKIFVFLYTIQIMSLTHIIAFSQIVFSVLLMIGVLLQQSEAGLGGAFGGGDGFSSGHHSKRGAEKYIFVGTIVIAILFAVTSFVLLLI